jgi:hypothetical protein
MIAFVQKNGQPRGRGCHGFPQLEFLFGLTPKKARKNKYNKYKLLQQKSVK